MGETVDNIAHLDDLRRIVENSLASGPEDEARARVRAWIAAGQAARERELREMRAILVRADYDKSHAETLMQEGMGPEELSSCVGSLEYTHGFRKRGTDGNLTSSPEDAARDVGEQHAETTPNAYEQKLEARRDRLRDRASRARAKSRARYGAARRILDVIPFGQPVLVGHHSERRHRRDLERIDTNMRKSAELSDRAADLERRADAVGTAGISSDDPDALQKLRAQLAARRADRDVETKWNREIRTRAKTALARKLAESGAVGGPDQVHALTRKEHVALIGEMAKAGAPAWVVKHMASMARAFPWLPQFGPHTGADIRRIEERIAQIEKRDAAPERRHEGTLSGADGGITFTIEENKAESRVQISFSRRPSAEITRALGGRGGAGFRWARSIGVWQRHLSNGAWYQACRALGVDPITAGRVQSAPEPAPAPNSPDSPNAPELELAPVMDEPELALGAP